MQVLASPVFLFSFFSLSFSQTTHTHTHTHTAHFFLYHWPPQLSSSAMHRIIHIGSIGPAHSLSLSAQPVCSFEEHLLIISFLISTLFISISNTQKTRTHTLSMQLCFSPPPAHSSLSPLCLHPTYQVRYLSCISIVNQNGKPNLHSMTELSCGELWWSWCLSGLSLSLSLFCVCVCISRGYLKKGNTVRERTMEHIILASPSP